MAGQRLSTKRALISKANSSVVIIVSLAVFVTIFSLVATRTMFSQFQYQGRVIDEKSNTKKTLQQNIEEVKKLQPAYNAFVNTESNIIGGLSGGTGPKDGNNAKIVLDALPSFYDYPAFTSNIEALSNTQGVGLSSITGADDEVAQMSNKASSNPIPVAMPVEFSVATDYDKIKGVIDSLEKSIRPIEIQSLSIAGTGEGLTLTVKAQSYYQPGKSLKFNQKVVK